ncbi:uncharacterized protein [Macrobrachium rosenbergii]|uniref:uncharacterized protein n=1 Tax=Macrobrachium rosenbergii TaxID=79674 RepID=UPI0034D4106F
MKWGRSKDVLSLKGGKKMNESVRNGKLTKRKLLSLLVLNFDPLGLFSPVFVKGKLLLQDLWEEGVEWDEVLSLERHCQAQEILEQFESVEVLEFEKGVIVRQSELHVFADASSKAYGAVVYVRDAVGNSQLLTSRMRVTQSKLSIPKLELLALVVVFRLAGHLFGLWNFACVVMWTNSLVAKTWVETKESSCNCLISNRVGEILFLQRCHEIQLKYVPTKLNPADILMEGMNTKDLMQSELWQNGTHFLSATGPVDTPPQPCKTTIDDESCLTAAVRELKDEGELAEPGKLWHIEGSKVSFTYMLNVMRNELKFVRSDADPFLKLVFLEQRHHLLSVCAYLESGMKVPSHISNFAKQLKLTICNQIIYTRSRIAGAVGCKAELLFLPAKSQLVKLYLNHLHATHVHCCVNVLIVLFRQECWMPGLRTLAKGVIRACRVHKMTFQLPLRLPLPPQLPAARTTLNRPFECVGLDHTGPVKTDTRVVYLLMITCMAS